MTGMMNLIGTSSKNFVNDAFRGKEPWQIVATTSATVLATVWLYNFLFDDEEGNFYFIFN